MSDCPSRTCSTCLHELVLVARLVFFFFATRRATFRTRFGLTFPVARPIRFRFAFTVTRLVTFPATLAISRLVPVRTLTIGTTIAVARRLSSAFGRTISIRASAPIGTTITLARASAIWSTLWSSLRRAEQFRRVELSVFVAIQFGEDFFQPIEFVAAEPTVLILVEQFKEPRQRSATTFPLWRTIAVTRSITLRTAVAIARRLPFTSSFRLPITIRLAIAFWFPITFWFAIAIRLAITFASSLWAIPLRLCIRTTITFGLSFCLATTGFPFANLSKRFHVVERQDILFRPFKHRPSSIAERFRDFIERHFAIAIRVHSLELLFGILIRTAPWISRSTWRRA